MSVNIGAAASKKRAIGKLWIAPTNLSLYTAAIGAQLPFMDLGNVLKFKLDNEVKTVQHKAADPLGFKRADLEEVIEANWSYKFTFDEEYAFTRKLLLATQTAPSAATQGAHTAPDGTASFTNVVHGGTYFVGDYNITTVVVTVAGATPAIKVLNVDYTLDAILGAITILPTGAMVSGVDDPVVTYGCAAETRDQFTTLDMVQVDGAFKLIEYDRHSTNPRQFTTFTGTCWVSSQGDNDGDKFSEFELAVRAFSKPVVVARQ